MKNILIRYFAIVGFFGTLTLWMGEMSMEAMGDIIQLAFWLSLTIVGVEYLVKKYYTN